MTRLLDTQGMQLSIHNASHIWAILLLIRISKDEKDYIESSIRKHQESVSLTNSTPWMAILTSPVVWSVATSHLASNWAVYQMNSLLPTYLSDILNFDITDNGLLSAAPFILQSIMTFFGGMANILSAATCHHKICTDK